MRKLYLLLLVFTINFCYAQNPIPNPGFDTSWYTPSPGQPSGWTDSHGINQIAPGRGQAGWAAQGTRTVSVEPAFVTGSGGAGIPISIAYNSFQMYYKFTSASSDVLNVSVTVRNAASVIIGTGSMQATSSVSAYTLMNVPITYTGTVPASVIISITMASNTGGGSHAGSSFVIDDLLLTLTTTVENVERERPTLQLFPNPASDVVEVKNRTMVEKPATVLITNILGQRVKQYEDVDFSVANPLIIISDLQPGNYMVTVKQGDLVQTKRLVVE